MPFSSYRISFPFTQNKIYLNHASVSPLSTDVREKMSWFLNERSFGEIDFYEEMQTLQEDTRGMLSRLINVPREQIAFTHNTSEGLNWLAQGIKWKKGDQVLVPFGEFPANVIPFLNLEKKGVKITFIQPKDGFVSADEIEAAITPHTRLLTISFVDFLTGYRQDLLEIGALCKKNNITFCVDAIQGLGAIPLDATQCHIDFLSSGGHKWLMGPLGTGFMYVKKELMEKLEQPFTGWLGIKDAWDFYKYKLDPLPDARRFEYATQNFIGIMGLSASLETLLKIGAEPIEQHLLIMGDMLVHRLSDFGLEFIGHPDPYYWSGIYSFKTQKADELFRYLQEKRTYCSMRNGHMRFAPHFYNSRDDINIVIDQISEWYINNS